MKKLLKIEGMTCNHCVMRVTKALEAVAGVTNVSVSLDEKNAVCDVEQSVSDEQMKEAVEEWGYTVVSINKI